MSKPRYRLTLGGLLFIIKDKDRLHFAGYIKDGCIYDPFGCQTFPQSIYSKWRK